MVVVVILEPSGDLISGELPSLRYGDLVDIASRGEFSEWARSNQAQRLAPRSAALTARQANDQLVVSGCRLSFSKRLTAQKRHRENAMRTRFAGATLLLLSAAMPALGQQMNDAEQEIMKIRQGLTDKFAAAVAKKDVTSAVNELYTADAVLQSLCPESPLAFGRDGYAKRLEGAVKNGFSDYSGKIKEAHLLSDGRAWTTGMYTFTVNDKEGKPERAKGNFIDMLRREGNEWKVMFQAYARTPC